MAGSASLKRSRISVWTACAALVASGLSGSSATAGSVSFSQHAMSAIEQLEGKNPQRFDLALNHALMAREHAINESAKDLATSAAQSMTDWRRPGAAFPRDAQIQLAITYLKNSLRHNRISLNRSSRDELALMKKLIKVHLFPSSFDQVEMSFEGITEERAVVLLSTYLVDPRSAVYDAEVRALVTGERANGEPASQRVKFVVGGETYDLPAGESGDSVAAKIHESAKKILDSSLPIRPIVKTSANQVLVSFEIVGFKYIPIVETYVRSVLSVANGNRYVYGGAEKLAALSRAIETGAIGAPMGLKAVADKTAAVLNVVEGAMRSKLLSAGWVEPTVDVIRARVLRAAELDKGRISELLKADLAHLKQIGAPAADVAARQDEAAKAIQAIDGALKGKLDKVDDALKALESSGELTGKAANVKASLRLKAAEGAAGTKVITWDRAMKGLSLLITAYHLYNGFQAYQRTDDPAEKLMVWRRHGVDLIHSLIYFVPVAGEIAAAIDIGGWVIEATVLKMFSVDYDIPDVAQLLDMLVNWVEDLGYRMGGSSRFGVLRSKFEESLGVTGMVEYQGAWTDPALRRLERALERRKTGELSKRGLRDATDRYRDVLSEIARKDLLLVYLLADHYSSGGANRDFAKFIGETQRRWGAEGQKGSYLNQVVESYDALRPLVGAY